MKAKSINISSFTEMQLNVDGEYGGKLPANFLNLKDISKYVRQKDIYNEELTEDQQVEDGIIEESHRMKKLLKQ